MSRESARTPEDSASLRRLLSSHHSIYNTLSDPLLELRSPTPSSTNDKQKYSQSLSRTVSRGNEGKYRHGSASASSSPVLEDSLASLSSWQSLNMSSFNDITRSVRISSPITCGYSRPASASILSNSTDEDMSTESLVLVPSLKKHISPQVLLFETDEEDEAEDEAPLDSHQGSHWKGGESKSSLENPHRQASIRSDSSQTFIMPKMSLSEEISVTHLMIVSSADEFLKRDIHKLVGLLQGSPGLNTFGLKISRVSLKGHASSEEISLAKASDLLLIVNDGCEWLASLTKSIVCDQTNQSAEVSLPSLAVVNLLSSDYFGVLFEILSSMKPIQMIKSWQLSEHAIFVKLKTTFETELRRRKKDNEHEFTEFPHENSSLYSINEASDSLIHKPNYKCMERAIRHEMIIAPEYDAVDPLRVSSGLRRLNVLIKSLHEYIIWMPCDQGHTPSVGRETIWFLCSFSLGIGLGLTVNALQIFKILKRTMFVGTAADPEIILKHQPGKFDFHAVENFFAGLEVRLSALISGSRREVQSICLNFKLFVQNLMYKVLDECNEGSLGILDTATNGFHKLKVVLMSRFI